MPESPKQPEKTTLHARNAHNNRYDFTALVHALPELAGFVALNEYKDLTIDFKNTDAVKALNKALLKQFYGVELWDIPEGYLCPPIPGRADYMHYMADVLAESNNGNIPTGRSVRVLDVGVGANCIYPLIGNSAYGWSFVGSDTDHIAVRSAKNITEANKLAKIIEIRKQSSAANIFEGIIKPGELFDLTMCNPPFHASEKEAMESSGRKWKNLGENEETGLNFGGRSSELWIEGGEVRFINKMMSESARFASSCLWFSSLISKKTTLPGCYKSLEYLGARQVKTIPMVQGQKTSRILAWTFMDEAAQQEWGTKHFKNVNKSV